MSTTLCSDSHNRARACQGEVIVDLGCFIIINANVYRLYLPRKELRSAAPRYLTIHITGNLVILSRGLSNMTNGNQCWAQEYLTLMVSYDTSHISN
jgi:hypothetical protein